MWIKSAEVQIVGRLWPEEESAIVRGTRQDTTMVVEFVLTAEDLNDHDLLDLTGSEVVLVKKREHFPKPVSIPGGVICSYCGGAPGSRRSCEGCGAPNIPILRRQ